MNSATDKLRLAELIELGRRTTAAEDREFSPSCSPVISHSSTHGKIWATALGFALLGLGGDAAEACQIYYQELAEKRKQWRTGHKQFPVILAAAAILQLPYDLAYEVQEAYYYGKSLPEVVSGLVE